MIKNNMNTYSERGKKGGTAKRGQNVGRGSFQTSSEPDERGGKKLQALLKNSRCGEQGEVSRPKETNQGGGKPQG